MRHYFGVSGACLAALSVVHGCNSDPCFDDGFVWQQNGKNCGVSTASTGSPGSDPTTGVLDTSTTEAPTSTTTTDTNTTDTTDTNTTGTATSTTDADTSTTEVSASDTSTTAAPVCGDMVVDPGEECDDGNQDDADACTNACAKAACGDGIVGPGEGCDDGNQVDDDACSNSCTSASCGDGELQPGEECDDANAEDTDDCLSTCKLPTCGDGIVWAGKEGCDDGNMDEADACTSLCQPPSCDDKAMNSGETDVDCGGPACPKCALDQACLAPKDCASSLCSDSTCVLATSCLAIKQADPNAPSGIYTIDPDGKAGEAAIKVYCDQATDGGGWTMLFKLSSGVAGDPNALWNGPALNEDDETLLNTVKSTKHYVSGFIGKFWNQNGVALTEARVHVYTGVPIAKFWKYDATMSTTISWYQAAKLTSSSYLDLVPPFNHYSILGEDTAGRRFHINRSYAGCPGDLGWLTVDTAPDPCIWEVNDAAAIRILYAPGTTLANWTAEVNAETIGVGDVFAVFVR